MFRACFVSLTNCRNFHFPDDIEPTFDGGDQEYHTKGNAAVHIKVTLKQNITKESATPDKSKAAT